ncbi:alpha-N-acetylglucosaminidase [Teleopsis dalmanni]|uniref:alpha-N-acetylglucosaminidase n=1 Tax=Teleopsis dalmanni TaxID=139649 RepID=UPI0018CE42DB|nr:alpha-N-acetylglucosaminidase [Teleopsis dalmanni]
MKFFIIITILIYGFSPGSSYIIPKLLSNVSFDVQEQAVEQLMLRAIGPDANHFKVFVDKEIPFRTFKIVKRGSRIVIHGWDGVSLAKGFHYYLKYYLKKDITWENERVKLPPTSSWPYINLTSTSESSFIYYQNVCTWSYSFAWWSWSIWLRHIDWMALMGISITIAPVQEKIWQEVYADLGLSDLDIQKHFAGPAFQAWQRMGNIRGWGGPLSSTYQNMQLLLQQKILTAQRNLGMIVALPAFAGHVPTRLSVLYPESNFSATEQWNKFPRTYCCGLFLDPHDRLFAKISKMFLNRIIDTYGTNNIYFADPFNEVQPRLADVNYMNSTAYHIYDSMRAVDPNAHWLLQGWMFVKNIFWKDELIKAFLTAVPLGRLIVLDLQSEQFPQYERTYSFHGQPFIWCMLHNFGGTLGMHGSAEIINTNIRKAREMSNSSMIGVGITPEGIHQNYVMYALTLERAWLHDDFDLVKWFNDYANVRYGVSDENLQKVWQLLRKSVYSFHGLQQLRGKYVITRRPSFNLSPWSWYNATDIEQAFKLLLNAKSIISDDHYASYEYDLVDLTRQFLQNTADRMYVNLVSAYNKKQRERYSYIAQKMLLLFDDLEEMLATHTSFLIGPWIEGAKSLAGNPTELSLYEINARNQITAWGPKGQILDYATKQWSGIVYDYYKPRWLLFLDMTYRCLLYNQRFNNTAFKYTVSNEIENAFSVQTKKYATVGTGNIHETAQKIFNIWFPLFKKNKFLHIKVRLI